MNITDLSQEEQAATGKQQLLVKMQLAQQNGSSEVAKQQLAVKMGLAKSKAERVST